MICLVLLRKIGGGQPKKCAKCEFEGGKKGQHTHTQCIKACHVSQHVMLAVACFVW